MMPPKAVGMPAQDVIEQDVPILNDGDACADVQQAALMQTKADCEASPPSTSYYEHPGLE